MSTLYLETSAILQWLFAEGAAERVFAAVDAHDRVVTSVLSIVETERALIHGEFGGDLSPAQRQKVYGVFHRAIGGWHFRDITAAIRDRAGKPFPAEPVRALDAIHLATALEFLALYPDLSLLSFDQRILANLPALGLPAA